MILKTKILIYSCIGVSTLSAAIVPLIVIKVNNEAEQPGLNHEPATDSDDDFDNDFGLSEEPNTPEYPDTPNMLPGLEDNIKPEAIAPNSDFVASEDGVLHSIKGDALNAESVTIPEYGILSDEVTPVKITSLGYCAFSSCYNLESITIPGFVETICKNAFLMEWGSPLKELTILDGVEIIESGAFASCVNLETIRLGLGLESIGSNAFADCVSLSNIFLPEGYIEKFFLVGNNTGLIWKQDGKINWNIL